MEKQEKEVKPKIAQHWLDALIGKKIVAVESVRGRTVGYAVKHPVKKAEKKPETKTIRNGRFEHAHTNNHSKGESKSRRLMAKQSRKINRK